MCAELGEGERRDGIRAMLLADRYPGVTGLQSCWEVLRKGYVLFNIRGFASAH